MVEPGRFRKIDPSEVVKKRPAPPPERTEPIICESEQEKRSGRIVALEKAKSTRLLTEEEKQELEKLYKQEEEAGTGFI